AGLSEAIAFSSSDAFLQSLRTLQEKGFEFPLAIHTDPKGPHFLHILISWVWEQGKTLLQGVNELNFDALVKACEKFFYALQQFTPKRYPLSWEEAEARFIKGEASVLICGAERPYIWKQSGSVTPAFLSQLGAAPIPGIPWVGGTNLAIWKYTQIDVLTERQALKFVEYLVSSPVQQRLAASGLLPTRQDALAHLPDPNSRWTQAIIYTVQNGRSYPPSALWGRIESSFRLTFERLLRDVLEDNEHVSEVVRFHLRALAHQLCFLLPPKEESRIFAYKLAS
ncbi:MAG: hypothetical protein ACK8QZ_06850, partial [Anaerolineales bacterium]